MEFKPEFVFEIATLEKRLSDEKEELSRCENELIERMYEHAGHIVDQNIIFDLFSNILWRSKSTDNIKRETVVSEQKRAKSLKESICLIEREIYRNISNYLAINDPQFKEMLESMYNDMQGSSFSIKTKKRPGSIIRSDKICNFAGETDPEGRFRLTRQKASEPIRRGDPLSYTGMIYPSGRFVIEPGQEHESQCRGTVMMIKSGTIAEQGKIIFNHSYPFCNPFRRRIITEIYGDIFESNEEKRKKYFEARVQQEKYLNDARKNVTFVLKT